MFGAKKWLNGANGGFKQGPAAAVIGAVVGVVGTVKSAQAAKDQAKEQKKAAEAQGRMHQASSARERLQAAREARIKRAQVLASTSNMELGATSSGPMGATSSIASQYGGNIGYANVMEGFGNIASRANQKAADAAAKGAMWQTIGGIGNQVSSMGGGWNSIFSSGRAPYDYNVQLLGQQQKRAGLF